MQLFDDYFGGAPRLVTWRHRLNSEELRRFTRTKLWYMLNWCFRDTGNFKLVKFLFCSYSSPLPSSPALKNLRVRGSLRWMTALDDLLGIIYLQNNKKNKFLLAQIRIELQEVFFGMIISKFVFQVAVVLISPLTAVMIGDWTRERTINGGRWWRKDSITLMSFCKIYTCDFHPLQPKLETRKQPLWH